MKKLLAFIIAVCMVFAPLPVTSLATDETKNSGLDYTESTAMLQNPFMGYPNRDYADDGGFLMLEGGTSPIHVTGDYPGGFAWYYIDLKAFSAGNNGDAGGAAPSTVGGTDKPISQAALNAFEQALTQLRCNGGSVFLRFVYDTKGTAGCEPNNFNMVITHLEQLCEVVSRYPDVVQGFECGIIGTYGEMHSSKYGGKEYVNRVIDAYLDNTPDSMVLLLRSPGRIADYLGMTLEQLAGYVPEKGSRAYRLGYYNDAYMNSDSDLGTWAYNRALETNYLAQGNTPYGGKYGIDYDFITTSNSTAQLPQNAIPEMYKTHVSFMRGNVYSRNKPSGGKNTYFGYDDYPFDTAYVQSLPSIPNISAFLSTDCFDFITAHIGYRLVLRESRLSMATQAGGTLVLQGKIENTGFANVLHNPNAEVLLVKDGAVYTCDVNLDASDLQSCTVYDYDFLLSLPTNLAAGDYDVYLRLSHVDESFYATAKSGIQFANNGGIYYDKLGANKLGKVTVTAATQPGSVAGDAFAQLNGPKAGAAVHQGAPALLAHGFAVSGSTALTLNAGESITLAPLNYLRSDTTPSYQWYKDGAPVSTQKELVVSGSGAYRLTVNSGGAYTTMTVNVTMSDCTFGVWATTVPPSCSSTGTATRTCGDCGLTETKHLPALDHLASGTTKTIAPTCARLGRDETPCALCGETLNFTLLGLPKPPHTLWDYAIVRPPSCTQDGLLSRGCTACAYTETKPMAAQHAFNITITGDVVSGLCTVCGAAFGPKAFSNTSPPGDAINSAPVPFGNEKLQLVGEGGFTPSYVTKGNASNITFLIRATGIESEVILARLRTLSYTKDMSPSTPADSNSAANYYGPCAYPITEDGVWAFTISRSVMIGDGTSQYFGGINWAAFSDPMSTKGTANPVNNNTNSQFQLLGIYDGSLAYDIIFVGANGSFLARRTGAYNKENNQSVNLIDKVLTADELYQGALPVKPADGSFSYTFAGWVDSEGRPIGAVITDVIAYPSFTAMQIDAQAVAEAKDALTWDTIRAANTLQTSVTANLTLPITGAAGTAISWSSNNAAIASSGTVTRPAYGTGNAAVTLTATITKGTASDTVTFNLTVPELPQTDAQAVAEAKDALTWDTIRAANTLQTSVTANLTLPITGAAGTTISWSADSAAISGTGAVARPVYGSGNANVTLTATITKGAASETVIFNLTVPELSQTDTQAVKDSPAPNTGDNSNMFQYLLLSGVSLIIFRLTMRKRKCIKKEVI